MHANLKDAPLKIVTCCGVLILGGCPLIQAKAGPRFNLHPCIMERNVWALGNSKLETQEARIEGV